MGLYAAWAIARAMKLQEVILRALSGQILWMQAAEILGITDRSMRFKRGVGFGKNTQNDRCLPNRRRLELLLPRGRSLSS